MKRIQKTGTRVHVKSACLRTLSIALCIMLLLGAFSTVTFADDPTTLDTDFIAAVNEVV